MNIFDNLNYNKFLIKVSSVEEILEWVKFAQENFDSTIIDGASQNSFPPDRVISLNYFYSSINSRKEIHFKGILQKFDKDILEFKDIKNLKGKKLFRKLMNEEPKKVPKWKNTWKDQ